MPTTAIESLTFNRFLARYPDDGCYELVEGEIMKVNPTRYHDDIADFIANTFKEMIKQSGLNYVVKTTAIIRTFTMDGREQGRKPDVSVIDKTLWRSERSAYSAVRAPIQLAVEVISTDYIDKLEEYQRLGIQEYWIVDYLALGGREFLGKPKVPAVLIFLLDEQGQYQSTLFKNTDRLLSRTFPELNLSVEQIFSA